MKQVEKKKDDEPTIAERTVNLLTVNDFSKLLSKDNIIAVFSFFNFIWCCYKYGWRKGKTSKRICTICK